MKMLEKNRRAWQIFKVKGYIYTIKELFTRPGHKACGELLIAIVFTIGCIQYPIRIMLKWVLKT